VIEGADLSGLIELKDSIAADIGKVTRTPLSNFQLTGQVAAAGTLKEQRAGLIAKTRDRQTTHGNSWEDAMNMARRLNLAFGSGGVLPTDPISTEWQDDEKPDLKELSEIVELLTRAKAASTNTKVKILHPEWTEKEVEKEVALIIAEEAMGVPDQEPLSQAGPIEELA